MQQQLEEIEVVNHPVAPEYGRDVGRARRTLARAPRREQLQEVEFVDDPVVVEVGRAESGGPKPSPSPPVQPAPAKAR